MFLLSYMEPTYPLYRLHSSNNSFATPPTIQSPAVVLHPSIGSPDNKSPPNTEELSTRMVLAPFLAAEIAAAIPEAPAPITLSFRVF